MRVLKELGLKLSQKPKANRPFSSQFIALGAEFKMDGPIPRLLPPMEKMDKFDEVMAEIKKHVTNSVPLLMMEKFAGFIEFMSRFANDSFDAANVEDVRLAGI